MGASSRDVLRPGAGRWVASSRNEGREYPPLKRIVTRWVRSCRASLRGRVLLMGARKAWGGMEAPGALEVTRFPSVIVPVCVVKGVSATPCVEATPGVNETPSVRATACVTETPCVEATPCVSGVFTSVPECVLPSAPCVKEAVCV